MLASLAVLCGLFGVIRGQQVVSPSDYPRTTEQPSGCLWQDWTSDSWPLTGDQRFQPVMPSGEQDRFLNSSDFQPGGDFYGETWEDRFWKDPTYYRPLGYRYARLYAYNRLYPCLRAHDTGGYKVELMVYCRDCTRCCVCV